MVFVKESHIVSNLLENLIIYDQNNEITYRGRIITEELSNNYPDLSSIQIKVDGEFLLISEAIDQVRDSSEWKVCDIEGMDKQYILFISSVTDSPNVVLSYKDQIFKISQIDHDLNERGKELECLYNVSHELSVSDSLSESLESCANHIMRGFQFPEITSVNIIIRDEEYGETTSKSEPVMNSLTKYFVRNRKTIGEIRVSYHGDWEFLAEENKMLKEITSIIIKEDERFEKTKALEKRKKILQSKNKSLIKLTNECQSSQEKLRTFFRAITDIIVVIDSDFNVVMSNKFDIIKGKKCYTQLFENDRICDNCPAVITFNESSPESNETRYDGKCFSLKSYPIINGSKSVDRVLEVCREITKEKQLENELVQSSKLASLGKLVAGVAHEINNPNTFILGNLRIMKEAFGDIIPLLDDLNEKEPLKIARLNYSMFKDNILTLVDDMEMGAIRMKKIVEDLRNYAKKDDGNFTDQININKVIEHTIRLVENQVKRHAKIEYQLEENIPTFFGNIQKLEQVFINLIINASQAIESEFGIIKISTEFDNDENEIIIRVKDNGKGMDENTQNNVFDPFFTTKRNSGGTGLGLSITYGIIESHKGKIDINSKLNEGTEFMIYLPIEQTDDHD